MITRLRIPFVCAVMVLPGPLFGQAKVEIEKKDFSDFGKARISVAYADNGIGLRDPKLIEINGRLFITGSSENHAAVLVAWEHIHAIFVHDIGRDTEGADARSVDDDDPNAGADAMSRYKSLQRELAQMNSSLRALQRYSALGERDIANFDAELGNQDDLQAVKLLEEKISNRKEELEIVQKQIDTIQKSMRQLDAKMEEVRHEAIINGTYFRLPDLPRNLPGRDGDE